MAELRLTPAARTHLLDIWDYTANAWGEDQADAYVRDIHAALQLLADNPRLGAARPYVGEGYRGLPVKQHVVFYTVTENDEFVNVIGVLHARMDVPSRLP